MMLIPQCFEELKPCTFVTQKWEKHMMNQCSSQTAETDTVYKAEKHI